ncbi:MAG: DUF533 domain-containing protein [Rhodospirillaceae bacterium]|nr:DUF533 domain-containing protein [Rhodospirillaceae bacterium]MDD9929520.1 DUF533 domain-containing protein [Rhodospirillaceae bacterium]
MNSQRLLDQFLGPQMGAATESKLQTAAGYLSSQGAKAGLVGVAGGGLLGLLMGNKKARKTAASLAGGVIGYGGAAALGAMALGAYQKWQGNRTPAATTASEAHQNAFLKHTDAGSNGYSQTPAEDPEAVGTDGRPFQLALVKALIAAANADGHICETERRAIMTHLSALALASDEKMFVYDALMAPASVLEIAQLAGNTEQAAEIYLVSRLFVDPDDPVERAYLGELAHNLGLPQELVSELEMQAQGHQQMAA